MLKCITTSVIATSMLPLMAIAQTDFTPTNETLIDLLSTGWEVQAEPGPGLIMLTSGGEVRLCYLDFKGGHAQLLSGQADRAERFSTIDANCAALTKN